MTDRLRAGLADLPVVVLSAFLLGLMLYTFSLRVGYPFDLEWMEGGMLQHAQRVMDGEPLYVEPSPEFIPFIYPPLYHWLLGWTAKVFGLSYALGRTLSMLGSLAAAAAAVVAARGEGRGWLLAAGAGALYLTGFDETGSFYDLVRTDGVVMGLLTWALVAGRHARVRSAGLLLTLAYLAKHNAAAFGLPMLVWLWWQHGRAVALRFAGWSVLPALATTAAVQLSGDRLFLTYLLGVPARHGFKFQRFLPGTPQELWAFAPLVSALLIVVAIAAPLRRRWRPPETPTPLVTPGTLYWLVCGALALLLSAIMRGHIGGFTNVLMPGVWTLSLWGVLAVGWVRQTWPGWGMRLTTAVFLATQLWLGRWAVAPQVPAPEAVAQGEALIALLAEQEGPILAPHSPWYPVMAGKQSSFHLIALWDIDYKDGPLYDRVAVIEAAMGEHRWKTALLGRKDLGTSNKESYGFLTAYARDRTITLPDTRKLKPTTGYGVRPQGIYRPRVAPAGDSPTIP